MALKFFGIDASGKQVSLTPTSGGSGLRILTDRILVGDEVLSRNWDTWDRPNGQDRFVELGVSVEAEEEPEPEPAPTPDTPKPVHAPKPGPVPAHAPRGIPAPVDDNPKPVHTPASGQVVPSPAVPPARK